jgi:hypothetical protein
MRRCRKLRDSLLSRPRRQAASCLRRNDLDLEEELRPNELRYRERRNRLRKVALVTAGFLRPIVSTFRRLPHHQGRDLHRRRRASSEHLRRGLRGALVDCANRFSSRHPSGPRRLQNRVPASRFVASLCCSPGSRSLPPSPFTLPRDSPKQYDSIMWVRIGETKWRQSALRGARCWSS